MQHTYNIDINLTNDRACWCPHTTGAAKQRLVIFALFRVHPPQTVLFMSPEVCHRLSRRMRVITSGRDRIEFTRLRISFPCRVRRDKPGTGPSCVGCEASLCVCPLAWAACRTRSTSDRCCCTRFRRPATQQRPSFYLLLHWS